MSPLRNIVRALGGDLYDGGLRANIPAPGHRRHDRSVSLLWSDGRIVVRSFGAADWRDVLDHLRSVDLIGADAGSAAPVHAGPNAEQRVGAAVRLWEAGHSLRGTLGERHLKLRGLRWASSKALRFHANVPIAVYAEGRASRPALLAAIQAPDGELSAVEITYVDAVGRRASDLHLSRKTIGLIPAGSAVRIDPRRAEAVDTAGRGGGPERAIVGQNELTSVLRS